MGFSASWSPGGREGLVQVVAEGPLRQEVGETRVARKRTRQEEFGAGRVGGHDPGTSEQGAGVEPDGPEAGDDHPEDEVGDRIKCPSFLQTLFKGFVLTYLLEKILKDTSDGKT